MKKNLKVFLFWVTLFIFASMEVFTFAQPRNLILGTSAGWDIYNGGSYRYGPSIIINSDNSIDAWFSSPGSNEYIDYYDTSTSRTSIMLSGSNTVAQKFTANWSFSGVDIRAYSLIGVGSLTLKLYYWNTDYATSIAGTPIVTRTFSNFSNNQWLSLDFETIGSGNYIWVASNSSGLVGVWRNSSSHYDANVSYSNGSIVTGDYNFRVVDSANHFNYTGSGTAVSISSSTTAAQKFTSANNFDAISVHSCSYANNTRALTLKLYSWNSNYQTTIAGTAIATKTFTNFYDNAFLKLDFSTQAPGSYLWLISNGVESVGLWKEAQSSFPNNINYYNGSVVSGDYKTRVFETNWDVARYKRSTDGGATWISEMVALKPTPGSKDAMSVCDPGVIKIGSYYYIGYTSTEDTRGTDNNLYIARSTSPTGPYEKWNGSGWGGSPQPVVEYTGSTDYFGVGEPSFVLKDSTIYVYYTWSEQSPDTRVATADANNPDWPGVLTQHGTALTKSAGYDSLDVKYIDAYNRFIGVTTGNRLTANSFVAIYESVNGLEFVPARETQITQNIQTYCHNAGISGTPNGHLDINDSNFIAYAYGPNWGVWNTFLTPITITKYDGADIACVRKADANGSTEICLLDRYTTYSSCYLEVQIPIGESNNDLWDFILADYNNDGVKDLYCISKSGGSNTTEVHVLNGATDYQTFLMQTPTALGVTDADWRFLVADYNNDGVNDLCCVNKTGDNGYTEMHILNGANNYASWLFEGETGIGSTGPVYSVLVGDYNADDVPDLYLVQRDGGSNTTEVHILDGASDYLSYSIHTATALHVTDQNYQFSLADYNFDGVLDLYAIKRTGATSTEAHIINGADNFQTFLLHTTTALPPTDSRWVFSVSR